MTWYIPPEWTPTLYTALAPFYDGFAQRVSREARRRATELLNVQDGDAVLIAGCGTGLSIPLLPNKRPAVRITGVDRSKAMLRRARRRATGKPNVTLQQADILSLPFETGSFDAILSAYVLDLLRPPRRVDALHEMKRVSKPGARIVTITPALPERADERLWDLLVRAVPIALGGGKPTDLTTALQNAGWQVAESLRTRNVGLASHLLRAVHV
ncbi:class I SAM-dependent methyltransferase [Longibacter salinarum]|uniref:class I SAM-dependent methyltransferase n=1 Tax=Longibacter salinarum TaxID=1850348 RepID=UPI0015CF0F4E|nr:class I SAM-dependent methyltransferase [Longibacter salinarum]